jgi:hypothetical protein
VFFFIIIIFSTAPVFRIIKHQVVGRLVDNELVRILKFFFWGGSRHD